MFGKYNAKIYEKYEKYTLLKGPLTCTFLLHILKDGVSVIILIPNIPGKNVYFMSYINLKIWKKKF